MNFKNVIGPLINFWEVGQGKVFGRINGVINFALLLSTWLIVAGVDVPKWFILVFIILMSIFFLVSGFMYIKLGLYNAEIKNYNRINPFQREVLERLDKIEKKMGSYNKELNGDKK